VSRDSTVGTWPIGVSSAETEVYKRAAAYNMPGEAADGMDVLAMYDAVRRAVERGRRGDGPTLLEARTYRFRGHSMSDPVSGTYRSTVEVEQRKKEDDPIAILRDKLFAGGLLEPAELEAMDAEARRIASEAAEFAENSPVPGPETLYRNVWAVENPNGRLFFDGRFDGRSRG